MDEARSRNKSSKGPAIFRPADLILAAVLLVVGFGMSFYLAFGQEDGACVTVRVDGKLYGTYALDEPRTVTIARDGHENVFEIKGGSVRMLRANCHGQDCIHEGAISKTGEAIVCLPHKIVLEVTGGEEDFDVIAQ